MTMTGYVCLIVIMVTSLIGMIVCSVRQRPNAGGASPSPTSRGGSVGAGLPTVTGEPVLFRTSDLRFVSCRASVEVGAAQMEERGFDPRDKRHRAAAETYYKKELAYILADQLLAAGAIRFERSGATLRAQLKATVEGKANP